jgi:hypothetical protein
MSFIDYIHSFISHTSLPRLQVEFENFNTYYACFITYNWPSRQSVPYCTVPFIAFFVDWSRSSGTVTFIAYFVDWSKLTCDWSQLFYSKPTYGVLGEHPASATPVRSRRRTQKATDKATTKKPRPG